MFAHQFGSAQTAFEFLYDLIMRKGELKGDGTKAMYNLNIEIVNPKIPDINTVWRKWSKEYAELEWEWYLTGNRDPAMVEFKAKLWTKMKDEQGLVWSNYGYWWQFNNQLNNCIEELRTNPLSRRAFIVHYSPGILKEYYKQDTPCNLVLNFHTYKGDLNLTVFARSIDLVYGFCNDQYCFSKLLVQTALLLKCHVGNLTYMITDLHIYQKHWDMKTNYQIQNG